MSEFKSFYKTVTGNEGDKCHYATRLDTYGCGCLHNCSYCYAKSLLEFRDLWHYQEPSVADINKIRSKIKTLKKGSIVRLGGMTDCFQPCEQEHRVTYETIKCLNENGIHYLIVTKSNLVASDEYIKILDKKLAHIQITVTNTNDEEALKYENATPSSLRIEAIEKLERMGFDVQIRLSPFIPEFIDLNVIRNIKCKRAIVEFLRVNTFIKKTFNLDYSLYTHKEGGYYHLPLENKIELIEAISQNKEVSVCEDCSEAYNYWKQYINPFEGDCCNLRFFNKIQHIGNMDLLRRKKIAFLSSNVKDKDVLVATENWVKQLTKEDCVISGFQSEPESFALEKLLESKANIIMVLARKMFEKTPYKFKKAIDSGKMLIICPLEKYENKTTKENAKNRNIYVLNRSFSLVVAKVTSNGMVEELVRNYNKEIKYLGR